MTQPISAPQLTPSQIAQIPSPSLPLGPQLTHLLTHFTTLSLQLFSLLSTSTPAASASTAAIYEQLAALDRQLAGVLSMLAVHQRRQRRVEALVAQVKAIESDWTRGTSALHTALHSLTPIIKSGALDRASLTQAFSSPLPVSQILSYARLLAPFTSAPPSSLLPPESGPMDPSGRSLPMGAVPPFPTEVAMRRGRLQFGAMVGGTGIEGETGEVGGESQLDYLAFRMASLEFSADPAFPRPDTLQLTPHPPPSPTTPPRPPSAPLPPPSKMPRPAWRNMPSKSSGRRSSNKTSNSRRRRSLCLIWI